MGARGQFGRWSWLWIAGYLVLMGIVVWSLFAAREWARTQLTTAESAAAWDAWREDVRASQDRPAPVQRRVPKSAEPPALVLTRDYFGVSLAGAILFSSALYWVLAWLISGILTAPPASGRARPAAGRPEN